MPRWEYCLLVAKPGRSSLVRYEPNGAAVGAVAEPPAGGPDDDVSVEVGRTLAWLGWEGWELVAVVPAPDGDGPATEFYLKRPLSREETDGA